MVDPTHPAQSSDSPSEEGLQAPESQPTEATSRSVAPTPPRSSGPLNLEQLRKLRQSQPAAPASRPPKRNRGPSDGRPIAADANRESGDESTPETGGGATGAIASAVSAETTDPKRPSKPEAPNRAYSRREAPPAETVITRVPVPHARRRDANEDSELESVLEGADLDALLVGSPTGRVGVPMEPGTRFQAKVLKVHAPNVFVSLGSPNEGVVPLLQFREPPTEGEQIDVVVRAFNVDEGLYELSMPGETIAASDWSDLEEGAIVEARVESANTGGVECKVGNVRGFIPISQLSEFRIESAADYVGQKLLCVVTEANPRRGNLVLSHRAVLEREKAEKRKERLASLEVGQNCQGIVRKLTDFGAFVDIGGLDGLIHISQLSWEKIKHPSEVLKEGDSVQVRIEKFDPKTAKISLSYRSLEDDPWNDVETRFPVGATVNGTVSRLANFGAFVKLATGVEGLIHISELAHRRIQNVAQVLREGQDVEVKILTVDADAQRIGLSLKATQASPESASVSSESNDAEIQRRESSVKKFEGQLRGGTGNNGGGELFGIKL